MTRNGDFKTGFQYLQATGMEELSMRGTEVRILALANFLSAPIYIHKEGKWHVYWSHRMKPFDKRGAHKPALWSESVCILRTKRALSGDGRDYQPDVEYYDPDIGYYEPDMERYEFEARYRERWTLGNEDFQLESGTEDEGARPADRRTHL
ncbi:hypothetical protein Q5P01_016583 [Channa striata]|uniref:Uncharacterized protein n=1 Tax=Channa striata TaxID=64152 RepID=A0AA88M968_CHASR|nr:hypothetical protein Q5P01_016583 [Channa striata]